jgi:hypothetical protein
MKRFCIKSQSGKIEYFDIVSENDNELLIRLCRISDGSEKVIEETMSRDLFNMCMKTGYVYELEMDTAVVA